jgi:hypothetical protein
VIYLRNLHPKQTVYLPVSRGWARVLRPAVTTAVPAAVLHTPTARALLTRQMIALVDGAAWNANARQQRALRADMACAIAQAEQREFDRLRVGVQIRERRKPADQPRNRWTPERIAAFRTLLLSDARPREIAATMGLAVNSVHATARRLGLPRSALRAAA